MKLTTRFKLNPNFEQEKHLHNLCSIATKLYNTANFERRWIWDVTGKIPNYKIQYHILKSNLWYKLLAGQTADEILQKIDRDYKSWFKLRKLGNKSNPPRFRKKDELSIIPYKQQFKITNNKLRISLSNKYKEEHKIKLMEIPFFEWKQQQGIPKFCQILFEKGSWYAHIVYNIPEQNPILNGKVMALDLGIINTATSVDTEGKSRIYSGKQILAIQHYFNKENAKLTSILTKQYPKRHRSRALRILQNKYTRQVSQALHTHSKAVINDCQAKNIKTLAVGDITDIRKGKNFGKITNQKLHNWSFSKFIQQLEYKAIQVGIRFVRVNEAYTSQTCSVCGIIRKSNRKHRGYYECKKCGNVMNADVNGAKNILKKYLHDFMSRSIGNVAMPSVTRLEIVPC